MKEETVDAKNARHTKSIDKRILLVFFLPDTKEDDGVLFWFVSFRKIFMQKSTDMRCVYVHGV